MLLILAAMGKWWNGRHAGLRNQCRKAWEFDSPLPYHKRKWWNRYTRNVEGVVSKAHAGSSPAFRTIKGKEELIWNGKCF